MDTKQTPSGTGELLRLWRLSRRISLHEFAAEIGVSHTTIWNLEQEKKPVSKRVAALVEKRTGGDVPASSLTKQAA